MSIRSVRAEIKKARDDDFYIDGDEARNIVKEAQRGGVTKAELKEITKVVENGFGPDAPPTLAVPEIQEDQFYLDDEAIRVFETFIAYNSPTGPDQAHSTLIGENPNDPSRLF